jgi:hypothetical protein
LSSPLAIAGVTAVLRDMIEAWLINQNVNAALGGQNAEVSAVAPDMIETTGANASPRLNLFFHQATENAAWRNSAQPSRDTRGERASSQPLALDLHYLLTAYGPQELQAEILLAHGMQILHEVPVLTREEIAIRLPPALRASLLGNQIELVRITPAALSPDEISKLWTAIQSHYRPTAAYHVSVVLISTQLAARSPLPVLTRGRPDPVTGREEGVKVTASLLPAVPEISSIELPNSQSTAVVGDVVSLHGHALDGTSRLLVLECRRLGINRELAAESGNDSELIEFEIPDEPAQFPAGDYHVKAMVLREGETVFRETASLPIRIVPTIDTVFPLTVARDAGGNVNVSLDFRPEVRPDQRVVLLLGIREVLAPARTTQTASLTFAVSQAQPGAHLVRLSVDGIESQIVDSSFKPPRFFDRRIVIT